jgi:hypothetical protein
MSPFSVGCEGPFRRSQDRITLCRAFNVRLTVYPYVSRINYNGANGYLPMKVLFKGLSITTHAIEPSVRSEPRHPPFQFRFSLLLNGNHAIP